MAEISKTTDQALTVLLALTEQGPMSPAELSRKLGLNRTVVHRLLATLHGRAFVVRQDRGYLPGPALIRVAKNVRSELSAADHGVLTRLSADLKETVVLQVRHGDRALIVDQVVAAGHVVKVEHRIGSYCPLEFAAGGRTLLAFADAVTIERALRRSETPDRLRDELDAVRQCGHYISNSQLRDGIHESAVPVRDPRGAVVAALAIVAPVARARRDVDTLPRLEGAANGLSGVLSDDLVGSASVT